MRAIDADALKKIAVIQSADFNSIETIRKWIDEQPTIDPVKHGKWIWDDDNHAYMCSECKNHTYGNTLECMDGTYRFCPYCGSALRGEQDG